MPFVPTADPSGHDRERRDRDGDEPDPHGGPERPTAEESADRGVGRAVVLWRGRPEGGHRTWLPTDDAA